MGVCGQAAYQPLRHHAYLAHLQALGILGDLRRHATISTGQKRRLGAVGKQSNSPPKRGDDLNSTHIAKKGGCESSSRVFRTLRKKGSGCITGSDQAEATRRDLNTRMAVCVVSC